MFFNDPKLLLGLTLIFWLFHIIRRIFYSLFYWQIKEYRWDRYFSAKRESGFKARYVVFWLFTVAVLIFAKKISAFGWSLEKIVFLLYLFLGLYSLWQLIGRKWRWPVFTAKMVFLTSLVFLFLTTGLFVFYSRFFLFILILEIFFPLFIIFCLGLVQMPSFFLKERIKNKAKIKMAGLKNLLVIGLAGSYGKSSTKEFLYTILSEKYKTAKTPGNVNTPLGIASFVLKELKNTHQVFICEMGAYKKGEIKEVCDIVRPKIGILTGLNEQHLALFGSLKNTIKAKYELIEYLPQDGVAFFNAKNKYCVELYEKTPNQSTGQAKIKKILYGQEAKFLGDENILGAMAVAKELGMNEQMISRAVAKTGHHFPGIEIKKNKVGLNIIDATYSANPDGVLAHLEHLKHLPGKKVVVMPCLIELGKASKEIHRKIGKKIAQVCDLAIITTKDRFKELKHGSTRSSTEAHSKSSPQGRKIEILFIDNPNKIFRKIKDFCKFGDTILLESRVPKELIKKLYE